MPSITHRHLAEYRRSSDEFPSQHSAADWLVNITATTTTTTRNDNSGYDEYRQHANMHNDNDDYDPHYYYYYYEDYDENHPPQGALLPSERPGVSSSTLKPRVDRASMLIAVLY